MSGKLDRTYILKGIAPKGPQEQNFTHGEKATALAIAKEWNAKGWKPRLISKTYRGDFKVWYDYRTVKAPARRKAA